MNLNEAIKIIDNAPRKNNRIYNKDLKQLIKQLPKDNTLACQLWDLNYKESRQIAIYLVNYKSVDSIILDKWVNDLDSWWIADAFACHLVKYVDGNINLAKKWIKNDKEFIRRAGFATIAQLAWSKNDIKDDVFLEFLPLIIKYSSDDRFYIKKAINWLLRDIAKRNNNLLIHSLDTINILKNSNNKTSQWIAKHKYNEIAKLISQTI